MKMRKVAMVLGALAFTLAADQVKLADGSVVNGKVTKIADGKISIDTAFAGTIALDAAKVSSISTDETVNVATDMGKTTGKFVDGEIAGNKLADVKHLWLAGDADPTLPPGRKWSYELSASIDGKTGNTEKCDVAGGFVATLQGPIDKLKLYLNGKHTRDNHATTEKEVVGGFDYERHFKDTPAAWYLRSEYEYDKINDLDPSITSAAGIGYYLLQKPDKQIRLRAGLTHVYKDYVSDRDTDSDMGVEFNYHHEFALNNYFKYMPEIKQITDISYLPVFDDFADDYRIYHESSLSIPLNLIKSLSLRLGVSNDYYSQVAADNDHMDTTYFMKLVLSWE